MKSNKFILICFVILILFMVSAVNAQDVNANQTDNLSVSDDYGVVLNKNQDSIYVNNLDGSDSNNGYSADNSLKTIKKAISKSKDNGTIYLSDGIYSAAGNTRLTIDKSLNIVGSDNTVIDGDDENYIFIINDDVEVTFKNIKFINAYKSPKSYSNTYDGVVNGAVMEIKKASVTIDNCSFINNKISYGSAYIYGGAISNNGDLTILNSYFENNIAFSTSGLFSYGGSVYNKGKLLINNTQFDKSRCDDFGVGGAIANDGEAMMQNSVISKSYASHETKGSAVYNTGNFVLMDSIIENNYIEQSNFRYVYGAIFNSGNLTARGNIFRNNTAFYEKNKQNYVGSSTIYNSGNLNLTYNAFIDNLAASGFYSDVYFNAGEAVSLENNWWGTNENPYEQGSIVNNPNINTWLVFSLTPEYSMLNISDFVRVIASWKNNLNQIPQISLFPVLNVTFETSLGKTLSREFINGKTSYKFSITQNKGQYTVSGTVGSLTKVAVIDVGKVETILKVVSNNNIIYNDTLKINITVFGLDKRTVRGAVSIEYDKKIYKLNLTDRKAYLEISNLKPGTSTLKVTYEGNDNYFKTFYDKQITIKKLSVNLSLSIPEIKVDESGTATATLLPKGAQGQAILYIDGERKKIVYLYNGNTSIPLKNFADGKYNVTLQFVETNKYYETNASAIFKVNRYDASINVSADDIKVGKDAIITVTVSPDDLRGEAKLIINNYTETIYLGNVTNKITLSNLEAGDYNVTVAYDGYSKYYPVNASTSFSVLKTPSKLSVKITQDNKNLNGTITVKTSPKACTGVVGVYINYRHYTMNLSNGEAKFNVDFDRGSNLIFVYYEGDYYYDESNWNTTIGIVENFVFIGKNATGWNYNDFDYAVRLVEENGVPINNAAVKVNFQGKQYTITTNDGGFAYLTLNLPTGKYNITSTYNKVTIQNTLTVRDINFNLTTKNISYGNDEMVEASFDKGVAGKVNFVISGILNETVDIVNNKAVLNIANLNAKDYVLKATYLNDHFASKVKTSKFVVSKANLRLNVTITNLSSTTNPVITVTNLGDASGKLIFSVIGKEYTKTIKNSQCIFVLPKLSAGSYDLTVSYDGDKNHFDTYCSKVFYITEFSTKITLTINNALYGRNLVAKATLNENATGVVRFDVENISKEVKISNGVASWKFSGIDVGTHQINATYLGNEYYGSSTKSATFTVSKANSKIVLYTNEVVLNENIRIYANLSENATGKVLFSMNGYYSPRYKPITDSTSLWYISPLTTGKYTVIAVYEGDKNYNGCNTTFILEVTQKRANLNVQIDDAGVNDRVIANFELTSDGTAIEDYITFKVAGRSYDIYLEEGQSTFVISKLKAGNYSYEAVYAGNTNYSKSVASGQFEVRDTLLTANLNAKDVVKYYGGSEVLEATLLTSKGKAIAGEKVIAEIDGKNYGAVSDKNGKVSFKLDLSSGNYTVKLSFAETGTYHATSTNASVTVLSTVEGIDVNSLYGSPAQYFAIFADSNGNVLGNTNVKFTIGNSSVTVKTLANGIARLNIELSPGIYMISTTNPVTGENNTNRIFIFNYLMENEDLTKYFEGSKGYKVRAFDEDGNVVGKNRVVKFEVNGVVYKVRTDKDGYATLAINLNPGTYTIKATYKYYTVSNKITVKSTIITSDLSKKKSSTAKFTAKLVDGEGKILAGEKITFKLNGNTYYANTNSNGVATITIDTALSVGTYKIYTTYGKLTNTNTITVKS